MDKKGIQPALWFVMLLGTSLVVFFIAQIVSDDSLNPSALEDEFGAGGPGETRPREVVSEIESSGEGPGGYQRVEIEDIDPISNSYKGIRAQITDSYSKKPIMNATVWYCKPSEGSLRESLNIGKTRIVRDFKGMLRLYDLEPGKYSIAVKAQGYETYYEDDLKVPQKKELLQFKLSRGTFIEGRVLSAEGKPVANVPVFMTVELDNPEDDPPARRAAQSDTQGNFLFGGLPPGKYQLFLKSMQYPLTQTGEIYLTRNGHHIQELYMPPLSTVEFSVTDPFGSAVVHALVKFYEKEGRADFRTKTDYYGKVRFDFVPPGTYTLWITKNTFKRLYEENFTILPGSDIITVSRILEKGQ